MGGEKEEYRGVVEKIIPRGKHGPYAVACVPKVGLVTFALDDEVWREKRWPDPGALVVLSDVRKKRAGWRAEDGRFVRPSDEQQQKQQQEENEQ